MKSKTQRRFDFLVASFKKMQITGQPRGKLYFTIDDERVPQGSLDITIGYKGMGDIYTIWVQKRSRKIVWGMSFLTTNVHKLVPQEYEAAMKVFRLVGKFNRMLEASA